MIDDLQLATHLPPRPRLTSAWASRFKMSLVPYESDSDTEEEEAAAAGDAAVIDRTIYGARPDGVLPGLVYLDVPASVAQCSTFLTVQRGFATWFGDRLRSTMQPDVSSPFAPVHACEAAPVFELLPAADQVIEMPLHISLSRYFTLRQEATDGFIAALRTILDTSGVAPFNVSLEGCQTFNASDPVPVPRQASTGNAGGGATSNLKESGPGLMQARIFLGMLLGAGRAEVLQLLAATDRLMRQHGLLPFYDPAEPHVSIAVGTQTFMAAGASGGSGKTLAGAASRVSTTVSGKRRTTMPAALALVGETTADPRGSPQGSAALLEARSGSDEGAGAAVACGPPAAKRARLAESVPAEDDAACGAGGSGGAGEAGTRAARPPGTTRSELSGVAATTEPTPLCGAASTSSAAAAVEQSAAKGASDRQRVVRTGDYAASSADVGCADESSAIFEVADVCVKLGRHVFRLPLPWRR
jgi:hypothetical protein